MAGVEVWVGSSYKMINSRAVVGSGVVVVVVVVVEIGVGINSEGPQFTWIWPTASSG